MPEIREPWPSVALDRMAAAAFRQMALERLSPSPILETEACSSDFDLNPASCTLTDATLRAAAVLVPIISRDHLTVLLTERTQHLSAHAGQIAFPGGRIEPSDAGPLSAALREANEEIGLDPALVEPLGFLEPYRTATGYLINPVVAFIDPQFEARPDPSEVASVFEAPLAFLMDAANHRVDSRVWLGAERRFYAMPFEQRYIWGATAGILKALHRRLFEA